MTLHSDDPIFFDQNDPPSPESPHQGHPFSVTVAMGLLHGNRRITARPIRLPYQASFSLVQHIYSWLIPPCWLMRRSPRRLRRPRIISLSCFLHVCATRPPHARRSWQPI